MNETLQATLADVVRFLSEQRVAFALIGGLAASVRGQPRVTADVDLVIAADVDLALGLVKALESTNFRPLVTGVEDVVQRAFILPLRHYTTNVKVDLALGLSGFEQQLIARSTPIQFGNVVVPVATGEDLLLMKLLANRPQDEQDISGIVAAQADNFDWNYCLKVGRELGEAIGQELEGRIRELQMRYRGHA